MMSELLRSGDLEKHIKEVLNPAYRRRYGIMMAAIERELVPLGVRIGEVKVQENGNGEDVFGGYFLWLELPEGVSAEVVADRAKREEELIVAPGYIFEVEGDDRVEFPGSLRLCFSWVEEEDLKIGVERLARVVRTLRDGIELQAKCKGFGKDGDMGEFR